MSLIQLFLRILKSSTYLHVHCFIPTYGRQKYLFIPCIIITHITHPDNTFLIKLMYRIVRFSQLPHIGNETIFSELNDV